MIDNCLEYENYLSWKLDYRYTVTDKDDRRMCMLCHLAYPYSPCLKSCYIHRKYIEKYREEEWKKKNRNNEK